MDTINTANQFVCEEHQQAFKNKSGLSLHQKAKHQTTIPTAPPVSSLDLLRAQASEQKLPSTPAADTPTTPVVASIPNAAQAPVETQPAAVSTISSNFDSGAYKRLPPPIVTFLEQNYGNWLNYFPIYTEWREDFGGLAICVRIPEQYSVEWKRFESPVYDNTTRKITGMKKEVIPDERWCSLNDISRAKQWLERVKQNIIVSAYRKGIRLPATNTGIDFSQQTLQQYENSVAGIQN